MLSAVRWGRRRRADGRPGGSRSSLSIAEVTAQLAGPVFGKAVRALLGPHRGHDNDQR